MTSETRISVRYAETDRMGIVHHSNYAVWYEAGRTDFAREKLGLSYSEMEEAGVLLPLVELSGKFLAPAYYEDELIVRTSLVQVTPVKIAFAYEIYRKGEERPLHIGRTLHGLVGKDLRPFRIRKELPELYARLEAAAEPENIQENK